MDPDEFRRKRRRLSSDTHTSPAAKSQAFVDLTGDSSDSEDRHSQPQPQPRSQPRDMPPSDDAALARLLQAKCDGQTSAPAVSVAVAGPSSINSPVTNENAALARRIESELEKETDLDLVERPDSGWAEGRVPFPTNLRALQAQEVQSTVRDFAQPLMKLKCLNCKKTLFRESDILACAQNLLDTPLRVVAELDCRSCSSKIPHSQTPAIKIWALLSFFDRDSKHNKPDKKKSKSTSKGTPSSHNFPNNGTGYGGARKPPKMPKMPPTLPKSGNHMPAMYDSEEDEDYFEDDAVDAMYDHPLVDNFTATYGQAHMLLPVSQTLQVKAIPKTSQSMTQPLDEDDKMTASVMDCLVKLLPLIDQGEDGSDRHPQNLGQCFLLCSSILERAADLFRNSLEEATRQSPLYMSLINFLRTISTHPSTCSAALTERIVRCPGVCVLPISLGKSELVTSQNTDTTMSLAQCMSGLASEVDVMLKSLDVDAEDLRLFQSIKSLNGFMVANTASNDNSKVEKNHWHKDFAVTDVPDELILDRHSLVTKAATGARPPGQMKRIMQEIARLKTGLPAGIFVRHCETRPDVMKILIVGPKDSPYENGLFEFDLLCGPGFPQKPPLMDFRTTGGGMVHFNPNLYPCGKICLSLLGTWAGEPWDPKQSTLLQIVVSIQAMIFCENPWQNEPGRENIPGADAQSKAYSRSLHQHTVQTAMLDWLEQRSFSKKVANARDQAYRLPQTAQLKHDTANIWTEIVKRHFRDNSEEIIATVEKWVNEPISQPPTNGLQGAFSGFGSFAGSAFNPSMPSGGLGKSDVYTPDPTTLAAAPWAGGAMNPNAPPYGPKGFQIFPQSSMMTGQGHVLGGAPPTIPPNSPTVAPGGHAAFSMYKSALASSSYNSPQGLPTSYGNIAPINPNTHWQPFPSVKHFPGTGTPAGPSGTGYQGKTLSGNPPGGGLLPLPFLPTTFGKIPPYLQHTQAQQVNTADTGTGWQGIPLNGEVPAVLGDDGLLQMLHGAVQKLKVRGRSNPYAGMW